LKLSGSFLSSSKPAIPVWRHANIISYNLRLREPVLGNYTYENNVRMDKYLAVALHY